MKTTTVSCEWRVARESQAGTNTMVIWKYELKIVGMQPIRMPAGAKILSAANQNGNVCLWAMVDPRNEPAVRKIEIIGTGNEVPELTATSRTFIGTVVANPFVWHVFERS